VVNGKIPPYCLAAGVPARVIRENVEWRRDFVPASQITDVLIKPKPDQATLMSTPDDELQLWRNQADKWREITPSFEYTRLAPNLINFQTKNDRLKRHILQEISRPSVAALPEDLYLLEEAVVSDITLVYTRTGELFAPSAKDHSQIHSMDSLRALVPDDIPILDGVGIFIFKSGKDNYGHLLAEMLPKLENVLPLGLDKATLILPYLPESLTLEVTRLITKLYGEKFTFHPMRHPLLRVKQLIYPGPVSRHNIRKSKTLLTFADKLLKLESPDFSGPKRIYVSREKTKKRRMTNEAEIRCYFESKGFVAVYPQEFSFLEQVQLFRNAEYIVGPHGAGLTNAIYAPEKCRVAMLDPGLYDFFFFDLCSLKKQPFTWAFKGELVQMTNEMLELDYSFPKSLLPFVFD
jgi:capsular polysaccharide biosynthesis protein